MKLVTYLMFSGQAEEAFNFYAQCLGGKITMLSRYGDAPGSEDLSPEGQQQVMHVRLEVGDQTLMASDNHPSMPYEGIRGCQVAIQTQTAAETERFFNALKDGGDVRMEVGATFWSECFGMLTDKFGVEWMVNCEKNPSAA
ncbi:VOC family protein [Rhodanobacter sp. L36]|uniref:VOC family protein n=1 Tax=Rhodanobacter sp. L36 TaxID=1747221 RepID=UPI00131B13E7|nr:VOC family protein [Rhodanobacter sp. L36]